MPNNGTYVAAPAVNGKIITHTITSTQTNAFYIYRKNVECICIVYTQRTYVFVCCIQWMVCYILCSTIQRVRGRRDERKLCLSAYGIYRYIFLLCDTTVAVISFVYFILLMFKQFSIHPSTHKVIHTHTAVTHSFVSNERRGGGEVVCLRILVDNDKVVNSKLWWKAQKGSICDGCW